VQLVPAACLRTIITRAFWGLERSSLLPNRPAEFQCERCGNGQSLKVIAAGGKPVCVAFNNAAHGNKCPTNLPFAEYCQTW
jgi:hypothetical protein